MALLPSPLLLVRVSESCLNPRGSWPPRVKCVHQSGTRPPQLSERRVEGQGCELKVGDEAPRVSAARHRGGRTSGSIPPRAGVSGERRSWPCDHGRKACQLRPREGWGPPSSSCRAVPWVVAGFASRCVREDYWMSSPPCALAQVI